VKIAVKVVSSIDRRKRFAQRDIGVRGNKKVTLKESDRTKSMESRQNNRTFMQTIPNNASSYDHDIPKNQVSAYFPIENTSRIVTTA
jgi:hypothetical protein